jgi:hypothetical protein
MATKRELLFLEKHQHGAAVFSLVKLMEIN